MAPNLAGRLPFVAVPAGLAAGFIVLFAAIGKKEEPGVKPAGTADARKLETGVGSIPVEKHRNILTVFDYINDTVIQKTKDHVFPAKVVVETTARVLNRNSSICDDPFLESYCTDLLQQYGQIDNFYIADSAGSRLMASRLGTVIETDIIDRRGEEPLYLKKRGGRLFSRKTEKELIASHGTGAVYDPRVRPWYKKAARERKLCWSDVYIFATGSGDQQPGFTVAAPTFGEDGKLLFVTAADFVVANISGFLRDLKVGVRGIAFLMNEKEELIGYPDAARVVTMQGGTAVLAKAEAVLPPWAKPALGIFRKDGERVFFFDQDGERYVASFAPFLPASGNNWRIVVLVPEEDFFNINMGGKKG
jgi:hypothetical protein